jgi:hypothetical protein
VSKFEERLLSELRAVIVADRHVATEVSSRKPRRAIRLAPVAGIAAAITVALTLVIPTIGGEKGSSSAYAVTRNADGTVTVKVYSIQDERGLERQIEDKAEIAASVHYLPQNKLCAPPWYHDRMAGRPYKDEDELGPEDSLWHQSAPQGAHLRG